MKLILLSDLHLVWDKPMGRLDNTCDAGLEKLRFVLDYATKTGAAILQAGDLTDIPRSWKLLSVILDVLKSYNRMVFSVFGQHDTYLYSEQTRDTTIMGILNSIGFVDILNEEPLVLPDRVHVYGASYGQPIPKPKYDPSTNTNVLVIHKMILMTKVWNEQEGFDYAPKFLRDHPEYDFILCGDAHQRFIFKEGKRVICNSGPMLRLEVSKDMMTHSPGFYTWEDGKMDFVEIPHRPASEVLSRTHVEFPKSVNLALEEFIASIKQGATIVATFQEILHKFLIENNIEEPVRDIISRVTIVEN